MIINSALRVLERHYKKLGLTQGHTIVVTCPTPGLGRDTIYLVINDYELHQFKSKMFVQRLLIKFWRCCRALVVLCVYVHPLYSKY